MWDSAFTLIRFLIGFVTLLLASYSDFRTRTVENEYWLAIGTAGLLIGLSEVVYRNVAPFYSLGLIAAYILLIFFLSCDYLYDSEKRRMHWPCTGAIVASLLIPLYMFLALPHDLTLFTYLSPIWMIWIFYFMYMVNLIHGGGDTKALMALSILLVTYPTRLFHAFGAYDFFNTNMPALWLAFTPSLSILMNGALVTMLLPLGLMSYNLLKGNISPYGFLGVRMPISRAEKAFVWPMTYINKEGKVKVSVFPRKMEDEDIKQELEKLKSAGVEEIWVTPKIPFIISLFVGFVLLYIWGPILFEILWLVMR